MTRAFNGPTLMKGSRHCSRHGRNRAKKFGRGVPRRCLLEFIALSCNQQSGEENELVSDRGGRRRTNSAWCMSRQRLHPLPAGCSLKRKTPRLTRREASASLGATGVCSLTILPGKQEIAGFPARFFTAETPRRGEDKNRTDCHR